jgi:transmembrane sensor
MLRQEAATWLVRLQGAHGPEFEESFRRWYEADPAHAAAFDRISRSYADAGLLRQSEFGRQRSLEAPDATAHRQPRYALAAALAVVLLVPAGVLLVSENLTPFRQTHAILLVTSVGEIRQVKLDDGSKLTLDTDSEVKIELTRSERRAVLRQGRIRLEVAADPRPFLVESDQSEVSTRQGVLDIELSDGRSRIEVLAGTAAVSPRSVDRRSANIPVRQGEAIVTRGSGTPEKYRLSAASPDWTNGMLQFDATPLTEAAARANRYSDRKILVADELRKLRVTGAYRAGDISGLARSLAAAFGLKVERTSSGDFRLAPQDTPAAKRKKGR